MAKLMINKACCEDGNGGQPESQDCLDTWEKQLEKVCNEYNKAKAETDKFKEEHLNSLSWKTKLKNWDDIIKSTDEKAKLVVTELQFFIEQIKKVCENSECTTEVLEKLICLVKSIFDCLTTYEGQDTGLKDLIKDFKTLIDCLQTIDEEAKAEVKACIEAYEEKIMIVCEMQDQILTKLLETLKCASLLNSYICNTDGLKDKLMEILVDFSGEVEDDEHCDTDDEYDSDPDKYPCDDKVAKPKPKFPISDSDYYLKIGEALNKAVDKTQELEDDWKESKKKSDCILSNKNSLTEAIKAAEAAESGK